MQLAVREVPAGALKKRDLSNLKFGEQFTDRMFVMEYSPSQGWHDTRIEQFHNFSLSPATMVFHYAQEIFEGLKAYKQQDGRIAIFRPDKNYERMNFSAERLCMPSIDAKFVLEATRELVRLERDWVPSQRGSSLYIRPTMIGVDPIIKVRSSENFMFYVILSPVGPYFTGGFKPARIMIEDKFVRASKGGTGAAKTGGNYASSIKAGMEAQKLGFDQVLWLDAEERKYVAEVGAMNIFFVMKDKLVTPELDGSILSGITRMSVMELARKMKIDVQERRIPVLELLEGIESGEVTESFGSGTAAVISPVGVLGFKGKTYRIGDGNVGKYTQMFYDALTGIQYGEKEAPAGWLDFI